MTDVLYDLPGPRARARNLVIAVLTTVGVVAVAAYVAYRLIATDQFSELRLTQFQYTAVQQELLNGLLATLKAAVIATALALVFGAVFAAARLSDHALIRVPATWVVELFRAIPLLILIFFFYYVPLQYKLHIDTLWALVLGLTLYNGSVLAEIFRAGILAVPRGQSEAAYAIGLRKTQVMVSVLLPQAVRAMLPAIVSQLVVLLKDTALGFIITYPELLYAAKQIGSRGSFDFPYVVSYLIVAAIYIGICSALSAFAYWLQKRMSRSRRTAARPVPIDQAAAAEAGGVGGVGA
ncbi:amino acid ABC transporter permease [Planosporangium mesophilum]|uniref:Amino acid ABC transporter permease n=1 Tax=Planosporangium mesophilum TaxID=689768 RepID=A0A8J3T936_9ACTN|nr:amino acid ABC transporter permease [Planosporangium mesophilum]NJC81789.1 amino acid ABC transporter permease [Planosporangium mesophilum]GII20549.1 amino acid ABC transporter permease [Planosporangium mesophilum]